MSRASGVPVTRWVVGGAILALAGAAPAAAQSIADRVEGVDGEVTFHFEGREGVEGCGNGNVSFGPNQWHRWSSDSGREDCGPGPVLVELRIRDGEVRDLETRVGPDVAAQAGRDLDLGRVHPEDAADYLLDVAERGRASVAEDAIFPAFLARDVEVWPRLIALARDRSRPEDVRSQALFWVSQEASGLGTEAIGDVARDEGEDQDVREAAANGNRVETGDEGVPILMELARDGQDPETRRSAMFWLAQSDEPEVVDFFEELLGSRR